MNHFTKYIVGTLISLPLIASASDTYQSPTSPQEALQAQIKEVAKLALECGRENEL